MNKSSVSQVWIPNHPVHEWWPGQVIDESGDTYTVTDDDNKKYQIDKKKAMEVEASCLDGTPDLLLLGDLNEGSLLHNIRVRYYKDEIYTNIGGPIIISLNPYKRLNIYGKELVNVYKKKIADVKTGMINPHEIEPHLYRVAETSYQALLDTMKNQSIIISGESGSGKTESAKIILKYLTQTSAHQVTVIFNINEQHNDKNDDSKGIEERVLDSNPILEAFGNAKTVRNDNSSRFGKFIEIHFDKLGRIKSASMVNYLLEKSRLVFQQLGERNYHIFYQMCYGLTNEERKIYGLGKPDQYRYLSREKNSEIDATLEDHEDFIKTVECIDVIGFTKEEKHNIYQIIAGILHLGNVDFESIENSMADESRVTKLTDQTLQNAAILFGLVNKDLAQVCLQKTVQVGNSSVMKSFRPEDAYKAKDGLVKDLYSKNDNLSNNLGKFFDWLIFRINLSISKVEKDKQSLVLGILDIFGFEIFESNSFEQLCINYTNEKLQQHFNNHIFKTEQEEYKKEGISWENIEFVDNVKTIELIEKSGLSIFSFLEEECMLPKGSDSNFLKKIHDKIGSNALSQRKNKDQTIFGIKHYAGEVNYEVANFVEKNKDLVNPDLQKLMVSSKNDLVKMLFSPDNSFNTRTPGLSKAKSTGSNMMKAATLTSKFKAQLSDLLDCLNDTNPSYIRCIKPNGVKKSGVFDSCDIMRQLKCAGILEAIRIRKAGFPIRRNHQEFLNKYGKICTDSGKVGSLETTKAIFKKISQNSQVWKKINGLWALGKTKIFMKEDMIPILDQQLYLAIQKYIKRIQSFAKKIIMRRRWKTLINVIKIHRITYKTVFRVVKRKFNLKYIMKAAKKILKNWRNTRKNKKLNIIREKFEIMAKELKERKVLEDLKRDMGMTENEAEEVTSNDPKSPEKKFDILQTNLKMDILPIEYQVVFKKMEAEIKELRKENLDLKAGLGTRGTNVRLSYLGNTILDTLDRKLKENPNQLENDYILDDLNIDNDRTKEFETKIDELERTIKEKDAATKSLQAKLKFIENTTETKEKENQFLREEVKKKEAIRKEKMQLEVLLKTVQKENEDFKCRNELLKSEVTAYKQKLKTAAETNKELQDQIRQLKLNLDEVNIQYNSLQEQETYFREMAAKKERELQERIELMSKNEEIVSELHNKVKDLTLEQIEKKPSISIENKENISHNEEDEKVFSESDAKNNPKVEELEHTIQQKNMKIYKVTKENQISKDINQTMVKLLKVKNIQIQAQKFSYTETGPKKDEAQKNLEKFQEEEKKLLKMLEQLMKQYETIENRPENS